MTNQRKIYECEVTESFIRIEIDNENKLFWIVEYYLDYDVNKINLFGILLTKIINNMMDIGIEIMTQTVYLQEWEILKKNKNWMIVDYKDDFMIEIKCKIEHVFDCLLDGFNYN